MSLAEGSRILSDRRVDERKEIALAIQKAQRLFDQYPDGVSESALIRQLKDQLGVKLRIAVAAVDRLEASGRAQMNWATGLLVHPSD